MRASSISSSSGASAPDGQACTQGMSSHISQGTSRAVKYGVPVVMPSPSLARSSVSNGQARTHRPQRMQAAANSASSSAPGGRIAVAGIDADCCEYNPTPRLNKVTPAALRPRSSKNRRRLSFFRMAAADFVTVAGISLKLPVYALTTLTAHFL